VIPRVMCASNPGGPQSYWVRRRWIERDITEDEDPSYRQEDYAYIPATLFDNPHINQEEYKRQLDACPKIWPVPIETGTGTCFPASTSQSSVSLFTFRTSLRRRPADSVAGLDWGYSSEGVAYGRRRRLRALYVEDEYVFNGGGRSRSPAKWRRRLPTGTGSAACA